MCKKCDGSFSNKGDRELKLDGGEIFNYLKSENCPKSFLSHIGKKMKIMIKNIFFIKHQRFMGHESYVLLCSKITSFSPSEMEFSEKLGIFSEMKIFQNPSSPILENINENYDEK